MNFEIKNSLHVAYVKITPFLNAPINVNVTKMHTRLLLSLLKHSYVYCPTCDGLCILETEEHRKNLIEWQTILKNELKTREHIPNKKESRDQRIARKKSGLSRKKKI